MNTDCSLPESSYWKERRTIRKFTDKEIDNGFIESVIAKAAHAPTTGGMQLYSAIITREANLKAELAALHFNQPAAKGAKIFITVVADFNRFQKWCVQRGATPGFDNFESFTAAFIDAVIFGQQLSTLLESSGLGVCYLGTTTYTASSIGKLLRLPSLVVPVVTLAVGHPAENGVEAERLPVSALVHEETYHDYSEEDIDEIYSEKEALPVNTEYVKANNVPSLAHVFTDIRYPAGNAVKFSKDFYDYINNQGFKFPEQK